MLIHRDLPYSGQKTGVRLQPENPDFQPIYSDHASILGKVIAVLRYY